MAEDTKEAAEAKEATGAAAKADAPADAEKAQIDAKDEAKERKAAAKAKMERALGEVLLFLAGHPAFEQLFLDEMEDGILRPVVLRQFRLVRNEEGVPLVYVSWAMMSEDVVRRIEGGGRVMRGDWDSGGLAVVMDVVAPSEEMAEGAVGKVCREVLKVDDVKILRPLLEGGVEVADFAARGAA